jgi:hypothetical protein
MTTDIEEHQKSYLMQQKRTGREYVDYSLTYELLRVGKEAGV